MFKFGYQFLLPAAILLAISGCSKTQNAAYGQTQLAQIQDTDAASDGNLAPVEQAAAQQPPEQDYATAPDDADYNGQEVYASEPPPPLPEYSQPPVPGDDYIWTPGYWSYANVGYYWVPGAWVLAPYVDALWTPPYWDFYGGRYRWHRGYWGRYIGFYGGINYGFGYTGRGYYGGYWTGGRFSYNRAVTNVTVNVHNVYDRGVTNFTPANRVSYNGGRGGIGVRPAPAELAALRGTRTAPVTAQIDHARAAAGNRSQFASANGGRPALVAQTQPLSTPYRTPASRPAAAEPSRVIGPNAPAREFPGQAREPVQNGRPFEPGRARQAQPEARPGQNERFQNQPPQNERPQGPPQNQRPEVNRPVPAPRPVAPEPQPAQQPAVRQVEPPRHRNAPEQQRAERPAPEARRAPQPPAPQPQTVRPEPRARPQEAPRPAPEARPGPPPARQQQPARQGPPPGRGDDRDRR